LGSYDNIYPNRDAEEMFRTMSVADVYKILQSPDYANAQVKSYVETHPRMTPMQIESLPRELKTTAAIVLSRYEMPKPISGQIISEEQFAGQARLMGTTVRQFPLSYRMDYREPIKVGQDGGFLPNPNKRPFTIVESVIPTIRGGGNSVSATLKSGNPEIIKLLQFTDVENPIATPQTSIIYEYEVIDITGFETPKEFGNSPEVEIVTRFIPSNNIKRFRTHHVEFSPQDMRVIEVSPWQVTPWNDLP
jgi:hypothetical protein